MALESHRLLFALPQRFSEWVPRPAWSASPGTHWPCPALAHSGRCSLRRGTVASPRFSFWRPERTDAGGVTSRRSQGNERGRQGQNPPAAGSLIGLGVHPILGFAMWLWTSDIRPSPAAAPPPFPWPGLSKPVLPAGTSEGRSTPVRSARARSFCFTRLQRRPTFRSSEAHAPAVG